MHLIIKHVHIFNILLLLFFLYLKIELIKFIKMNLIRFISTDDNNSKACSTKRTLGNKRIREIFSAELSDRNNDSNKFAPLIASHDRSIMRAWCESSWRMKESEYQRGFRLDLSAQRGREAGFHLWPSCSFSSFLSPALRHSVPALRSSLSSNISSWLRPRLCSIQYCHTVCIPFAYHVFLFLHVLLKSSSKFLFIRM